MTIKTMISYKKLITEDLLVADTFIKRLCGFMFRKELHHEALMLKPCNSIHTFFMRCNIDVAFLDNDMTVVSKIESLPPGKVIMPIKGVSTVVETKEGMLRDIQQGDRIWLESVI